MAIESASAAAERYEGMEAARLARLLDVPLVVARGTVPSTLDVAHELASGGAPSGSLVLADGQSAGRGRGGRRWESAPGEGIWMTLIERPRDAAAAEVLALRIGLAAARVLDRFAGEPVRLKWPNDLWLAAGKLGGVLVEARWRGGRLDWAAIGLGINRRVPPELAAAALPPSVSPLAVLGELVPALRGAASARGSLSESEVASFAARDLAAGRPCREPEIGIVRGITGDGRLVIETPRGLTHHRAGSLVLEDA